MNIRDRIIELALAAFDRFMDFLALGDWTRVHESEIPNIIKIKEM